MSAAAAPAGEGALAPHRGLITISVMLASIMQALDNTIANVALPRIQGSLSATQDQMAWVLTSYIIAAAIMTPLSGWLAGQVGRKRVFLFSVVGFTVSSALCGLAHTLPEIIAARARPGTVRRRADPDVAGGAARHQPALAARAGDGDLGDGRHHRPDPRPRARGLAHRELQLALGLLHQRALRDPVVPRHPHRSCRRRRSAGRASTSSASPR